MVLIEPGKLWQNHIVESFAGKFHDVCLSMEWFRSRVKAKCDRMLAASLQWPTTFGFGKSAIRLLGGKVAETGVIL